MAELEKMSGEALVDGFGNASIGTNDARWRELRAELLRRLSECEGLREERDRIYRHAKAVAKILDERERELAALRARKGDGDG